jgi:TorA maturation chaperone TorD/NAD-dependent dihydropyrimidine dehydrogenase PreA subunit
MLTADRAALYVAFAEVLSDPPDWMSLPAREWPLFELAVKSLPASPAILGLSSLSAESNFERRVRYETLFGNGCPRFWLHESGYLSGRILGGETFAVARFYRVEKLEVNGAELPDHASSELSFLAHLAERGDSQTEQAFLDQHALCWLPALGRSLSSCDDPVYASIGQLLVDFLEGVSALIVGGPEQKTDSLHIPFLSAIESCTLCGFCSQRCSIGAMFIHETESTTSLMLNAAKCNGCGRCISACQDGLLTLVSTSDNNRQLRTLLGSKRVPCTLCGAPTVSRAEINYMIEKIGHPVWLDTCLACRVAAPIGGNK